MTATYAGRYDEPLLKYVGRGRLVPAVDAEVTVYESDGVTLATLYTDRTKATTGTNPIGPDENGNLEFFADPGTYVLSVVEDEVVQRTDTVVVSPDPTGVTSLEAWTEAGAFEMLTVTYDATYTTVISSATVQWPDGSAGTFTTTSIDGTWEAIDAFTITHDDTGLTVTQAAVTRNAAGYVTTKPALTVA